MRSHAQGEVQCIMGNGHIGTLPLDRMVDTTENIPLLQFHWWVVNMSESYCVIFTVLKVVDVILLPQTGFATLCTDSGLFPSHSNGI